VSCVVLSLGANLGDRLAALQRGLDLLAAYVTFTAVSPVYETAPVGGVEQPDFLNAVALGTTSLDPRALVEAGQRVERTVGRVPGERWGPRALDIDVVTYDDVVSDDPVVTLPHPRAHERAFVLRPWLDVEPGAALPGHGAVADLAAPGDVRQRPDLVLRVPS
jgi:2-amino-4-hydroxy-6-hydroxymethyldihydropteridine diphosphokinase